MTDYPTRKGVRLGRENYRGDGSYFTTICCDKRSRFFADPAKANRVVELMREVASTNRFRVHTYCVMPDHLHLLAQGSGISSDLIRFVRVLKLRSAFEEKKSSGRQLWQRSFYEHIVRPHESADSIAWYIWLNPVRKGMCSRPQDYPFLGSFTGDWFRRYRPLEEWCPPWKKKSIPNDADESGPI